VAGNTYRTVFSGPGFFISMMQTAWCVYLYILAHATLAIADLEMYRVYRYFKVGSRNSIPACKPVLQPCPTLRTKLR